MRMSEQKKAYASLMKKFKARNTEGSKALAEEMKKKWEERLAREETKKIKEETKRINDATMAHFSPEGYAKRAPGIREGIMKHNEKMRKSLCGGMCPDCLEEGKHIAISKPYKIKFRLWVVNRTVIFCIDYMDERFRNKNRGIGKGPEFISASNGLRIHSAGYSELQNDWVYLRGADLEDDDKVCTRTFASVLEANNYINKVRDALKDWAQNWEGFKEKKGKSVPTKENEYEF